MFVCDVVVIALSGVVHNSANMQNATFHVVCQGWCGSGSWPTWATAFRFWRIRGRPVLGPQMATLTLAEPSHANIARILGVGFLGVWVVVQRHVGSDRFRPNRVRPVPWTGSRPISGQSPPSPGPLFLGAAFVRDVHKRQVFASMTSQLDLKP